MKITRKCARCGKNYESTDRKNASIYCGKICKDEASQDNLFKNDNVSIGLEQVVEISDVERLRAENEELKRRLEESEKELEPTLEEIEARFKPQRDLNKSLLDAIYLLKEHSAKSKDIQHLYNRQSILDQLKNDCSHTKEFGKARTRKERDALWIKEQECLAERRCVKDSIAIYHALSKTEGWTRIAYSTIIPFEDRVYNHRILDCGVITADSKIDIVNLGEKPKSIDEINTVDIDEYIKHVNSLPLTSKMSLKSVNYSLNNLSDLKTKILQMQKSSTAYKSFRIEGNLIKCYV